MVLTVFIIICSQTTNAALAEETSAETLYETAFKLIVEGRYGEAYDQLNLIIAKYPDTVYARFAADRKQRLEKLNLSSIRRKKIDQSGRIGTVVFSTLYSTWLGIGTARLADNENGEKAVAAGMMLGAPAGLLSSLVLTRNAKLTQGQSALINFSGYWGTWQGLGWTILSDKDDDERSLIAGAMAGGLVSLLTTSALTRKIDLSLGDAGIINYGGLWGTWLSLCSGIIADIDDRDELLGLTLVGGNLGAATMASLSPKIDISFARANLINLGGIIGTIVASGLLLIISESEFDVDQEETIFAILMAGGVTGLVVGALSTRDFDAKRASQKSAKSDRLNPNWNRKPLSLEVLGRNVAVAAPSYKVSPQGAQINLVNLRF